jgi:hypothetical protein
MQKVMSQRDILKFWFGFDLDGVDGLFTDVKKWFK